MRYFSLYKFSDKTSLKDKTKCSGRLIEVSVTNISVLPLILKKW